MASNQPQGSSKRPRHPKKELEQLLRDVESHGWTVAKGQGYYRARCPCGAHQRSVQLSPSNPLAERNLRAWFTRQTCWDQEVAGEVRD
jgi:hypothetical protein